MRLENIPPSTIIVKINAVPCAVFSSPIQIKRTGLEDKNIKAVGGMISVLINWDANRSLSARPSSSPTATNVVNCGLNALIIGVAIRENPDTTAQANI